MARVTRSHVVTAGVALTLGVLTAVFYTAPGWISVPALCAFVYVCGVMDGRAGRRLGRLPVWLADVKAHAAAARRPDGAAR
ncbi:hypothetical protein ABZ801_41435 [Actinomadura sp. NPDC047616]|uniref:hypothetical protein n=1 Tax=Actinomadura sp. NPDC047616 TaxID=3155914 RepID=UPI0033C2E9C4